MMYCECCRVKFDWPPGEAAERPHGKCESCGNAARCHVVAGTPSSRTIAEEEADRISVLEKQVHDLKISMMVLDATIYMIAPLMREELKELFASQIAVAKQSYQQATGEESMIGFRRNAPAGKARVKLSGADRDQDWPWCESCNSYHHPSNTTCKAKRDG